jgi:hypothetical protein
MTDQGQTIQADIADQIWDQWLLRIGKTGRTVV